MGGICQGARHSVDSRVGGLPMNRISLGPEQPPIRAVSLGLAVRSIRSSHETQEIKLLYLSTTYLRFHLVSDTLLIHPYKQLILR